MNKTLSQIKPKERDTISAMNNTNRQMKIATSLDDPFTALEAYQSTQLLKSEHLQYLHEKELDRQHNQLLQLSQVEQILYEQTIDEQNALHDQLVQKQEQQYQELLDLQKCEIERLISKINSQQPKKVQNREFLILIKEYQTLMKLKKFEAAMEVKTLAQKAEQKHLELLFKQFDEMKAKQLTYYDQLHQKQQQILKMQFQTQLKDFEKHRNQATFCVVQNIKNSKIDMETAHANEFVNNKLRCVDNEIVNNRKTQTCNATFRGSQKLTGMLRQ